MKNLDGFEKDDLKELNLKQREEKKQLTINRIQGQAKSDDTAIVDLKFWTESPKPKIENYLLVKFLEANGIRKVREKSSGKFIMVSNKNGIIEEVQNQHITEAIRKYLEHKNELDVLGIFSNNVGHFVNVRLFEMLKTSKVINDKDSKTTSFMYFKNKILIINKTGVKTKQWSDFKGLIWRSRIIDKDIDYISNEKGDFETFCFNLSNQDESRFKSLKTIIGYLLHRYQDLANQKAIILMDENISFDNSANGRRGKSLLCNAIAKCREVVNMSGKSIKTGNWFKNQRITRTTDIVWYDDVKQDFNFEDLYDTITSGMVIEKKHKDEFYIKPEDAPKTLISSNYVVRGTGGSSDRARRCEFEVSSHYSEDFSPLDEFKIRFFSDWEDNQWNLFYSFMANCISEYLKNGLIIPEPINLERNRIINITSEEFVDFFNNEVSLNEWMDNRELLNKYRRINEVDREISSNKFSRMMKAMSAHLAMEYESKSTGGNYYFKISKS